VSPLLQTSSVRVFVRGGGDLASGVAWRLHQCGFRVVVTEIPEPLAVRRKVAFCEAVYDGQSVVEGVTAVLITGPEEVDGVWDQGFIPVLVDPGVVCRHLIKPEVIVDAILAKKNLGTSVNDAPLVVAIGPGFEVGKDAHFVVETNRGHHLGRLLTSGSAAPDTGFPARFRVSRLSACSAPRKAGCGETSWISETWSRKGISWARFRAKRFTPLSMASCAA